MWLSAPLWLRKTLHLLRAQGEILILVVFPCYPNTFTFQYQVFMSSVCFPPILSFVMDLVWPDLHCHWSLHDKYLQGQNSKSSSDLYSHNCHPCVHGLDGVCDHPLRPQDGLEECPCWQSPWCYQVNHQLKGFCHNSFCTVNLEIAQNTVSAPCCGKKVPKTEI